MQIQILRIHFLAYVPKFCWIGKGNPGMPVEAEAKK